MSTSNINNDINTVVEKSKGLKREIWPNTKVCLVFWNTSICFIMYEKKKAKTIQLNS